MENEKLRTETKRRGQELYISGTELRDLSTKNTQPIVSSLLMRTTGNPVFPTVNEVTHGTGAGRIHDGSDLTDPVTTVGGHGGELEAPGSITHTERDNTFS